MIQRRIWHRLSLWIYSRAIAGTVVRSAALLVPPHRRAEWLDEWRAELWHVWQDCHARGQEKEAMWFACGAFQDAWWMRQNEPVHASRKPLRFGAPLRCLLMLTLAAVALLLAGYSMPGSRAVMQRSPYQRAGKLMLISRNGMESSLYPTIHYAEYQEWKRNSGRLFSDLAFYQIASKRIRISPHVAASLQLVRGSSNLFHMLGVPVALKTSAGTDDGGVARLVLSERTWRHLFSSDPGIVGKYLRVAGEDVVVSGVLPEEQWQLPGHAEAWLLESESNSSAFMEQGKGFVLAALAPGEWANHPMRRMYVKNVDGDVWFNCETLAERLRGSFTTFWFSLLLACLALPATTSLPLGEYPVQRQQVPCMTRVRRWLFLGSKLMLIVAVVYSGSIDVAYGSRSMKLATSEYVQLFISFWSFLIAFRWALRDQRKRCPVCLRILTHPARVGQFSRNFLAWNGTELVCLSGHGLLHVPDLPTSWFSSQRWLYLDTSWSSLFSGDALVSAGTLF